LEKIFVRETLPLAGTPYVEMPAVMAKYNVRREGWNAENSRAATTQRSLKSRGNSAAAWL